MLTSRHPRATRPTNDSRSSSARGTRGSVSCGSSCWVAGANSEKKLAGARRVSPITASAPSSRPNTFEANSSNRSWLCPPSDVTVADVPTGQNDLPPPSRHRAAG